MRKPEEALALDAEFAAGWLRCVQEGYVLHVDQTADRPTAFAESVAEGLSASPRRLHCRWLYDEIGSQLYERITEQPEYYLTDAEDEILRAHGVDIRARAGDATLVELGSGSSAKTRHLLDAWVAAGPSRYVPVDISRSALEAACGALAASYPRISIEGIVSSFRRGVPLVRELSPLTLAFLGSTIGNFEDDELEDFMGLVAGCLSPGDHFLLGIDTVKEPARLLAAYDDAAGWTSRFTLNIFARMNRELGTDIPIDALEHVAIYNPEREQIEIYTRFHEDVDIELAPLGRSFRICEGEMLLVEISRKFRPDRMVEKMAGYGLVAEQIYSDPQQLFAVLLLRREQAVVEV